MTSMAAFFAPIRRRSPTAKKSILAPWHSTSSATAASGLLGYLALGSNGENRSLTEEERRAVLRTIVRRKRPDQLVMAGRRLTTPNAIPTISARRRRYWRRFRTGAFPGYFRKQMTDEVLFRYFFHPADGSPIPLLLYTRRVFAA